MPPCDHPVAQPSTTPGRPRSAAPTQVSARSLLTVVVRQLPLVPAPDGRQVARPPRTDDDPGNVSWADCGRPGWIAVPLAPRRWRSLMPTQRERVPIRTIAVTIGMVLATAAILLLGWEVRRVLTWIVVAALLSIILGPVTDLVERRLHLRRSLATLLVFLLGLVLLVGVVTVFIRPIAKEGPQFIDKAPAYVAQAQAGKGPVGRLIKRYQLAEHVSSHQAPRTDART